MTRRDAAVAAARRGWHVFPCRPGDKRPAVDRWEERACSDPERVARYWPSGRHNVGVAAGPSRLVVIDLDTSPGDAVGVQEQIAPYGAARLAAIVRELGQSWPDTLTVTTPSGGWHLYYAAIPGREIRNSASKIGPKIDVRASGGYVIGAGSMVGGKAYQVIEDREVAPLPGWLADLAAPRPLPAPGQRPYSGGGSAVGRLRGVVAAVLEATPGADRNSRLFWASCRAAEMVAAGELDEASAVDALTRAGEATGLRQREVQATISSGMRGRT